MNRDVNARETARNSVPGRLTSGTSRDRGRPSRSVAGWSWLVAFVLGAMGSCKPREPGELVPARKLSTVSVPADDPGPLCADLGQHRICYSELCPGGICVMPRPSAPDLARHAAEYRCTGAGAERRCRPRSASASAFECRRGRCVQRHPRLPDDAEWECVDLGGAVLCRGGQAPAGVVRGQPDPGWWCSARRNHPSDRLCLDLDPDVPRQAGHFVCRFEREGARAIRVCELADEPLLGDACETESECPSGARCARGTCVPPTLNPVCWTDADCRPETCRLASCGEGVE